MRRLSLWMRRHRMVGDSVIALLVAVPSVAGEGTSDYSHSHPFYYWLVLVLMVPPLVVRRRWPVLAAYVIAAGGAIQLFTHGSVTSADPMPVRVSDLSLAIALYTLVVYTDRRKYLLYAVLLVTGTGVDIAWKLSESSSLLPAIIGSLLIYGFAWVLGEFIGARTAYHAEVEARLRLLETERDQQAKIAVAAERTRIARELHDVVAHAVSVIVVQADGAGYAIRTHPEMAETAVHTISETGREALIELRRLLEVLRSDTDEPDSRAPQPGMSGLRDLVDKVSGVGLPVALTVLGDVADLPAAVGLGIYRIVQEALTNSLRHAGAGAWATVRVERVGGLVEVEVTDNGGTQPRPPGGRPVSAGGLAAVSGGNGLIGMRERATVLGGTLTAGRADTGGWRVRATFPVRASRDATVA